jgi:hypothetical protein
MSDELRAAAERFDVWSFLRDVLRRGAAIDHGCAASGEGYEVYSARLDAAARRLADQLRPHLADRPADDAEPVTMDRLLTVGFHDLQDGSLGIDVGYDTATIVTDTKTWSLVSNDGDGIGIRPPKDMGDVRRLLLALGITPTPKG